MRDHRLRGEWFDAGESVVYAAIESAITEAYAPQAVETFLQQEGCIDVSLPSLMAGSIAYGYVRVWPTSPSIESQIDVLRRIAVDSDRIWKDDQRTSRSRATWTGQEGVTVRQQAINAIRTGDVLVVACPVILGSEFDDLLGVLQQVEKRRGCVFDAQSGCSVVGISMAVRFAKKAVSQSKTTRCNEQKSGS